MSQGQFPFYNDICKAHHFRNRSPVLNVGVCVVHDCGKTWPIDNTGRLFCDLHSSKSTTSKYPVKSLASLFTRASSSTEPGVSDIPCNTTRAAKKDVLEDFSVTQRAKSYVFANRYLVQEPPEICSFSVRQKLADFENTAESVPQIIDLVSYTMKTLAKREMFCWERQTNYEVMSFHMW